MCDKPKPETPAKDASQPEPLDRRGPRPTDHNELAKWIVEQTTGEFKDDPKQAK